MIKVSNTIAKRIIAPVRTNIRAKVYWWRDDNSGEVSNSDYIKSFTVERIGDTSKFFGFGVCQKFNIKLRDTNRELDFRANDFMYCSMGCGSNTFFTPAFKITEVNRDENTNELSITAYDTLYSMSETTFADLDLQPPYSYIDVIGAIANYYTEYNGMDYQILNVDESLFETVFTNGANLDGTETLKEILDSIAQATQTVYFINENEVLTFKRLSPTDEAVYTIDRDMYFELDTKSNRRLSAICHCTELGDNVEAKLDITGTTQYVRDNPFWELQDSVGELVNDALTAVGGLTINQFTCSWRGNYTLQPLDKIELITKNGESVYSYVINDVLTYDGGMKQNTEWIYEDNNNETATNPTSLGETLKATYAKVDKANRQIEIVASETTANTASISALRADTDSIGLSVSNLQQTTTDAFGAVNEEIATLKKSASLQLTEEDVQIKIETELSNGVDRVTTATGFTFDEEGLTVSKTNSEMSTQITEDGMTVSRDSTEVLVANHKGVKAKDLHAETYLIIGTNSRFEDYGNNRTGCFWIGG